MYAFIITLQSNNKRLENSRQIKSQLEQMGFSTLIVNAVTPSEIDFERVEPDRGFKKIGKLLTDTEICCTLSHVKIYEYIKENDIEEALILEDNVCIHDNLFNIYSELKQYHEYDIIHLHSHMNIGEKRLWQYNSYHTLPKLSDNVYVGMNENGGTKAYIITKQTATYLLENAFPIWTAADGLTNWITGWWTDKVGIIYHNDEEGRYPVGLQSGFQSSIEHGFNEKKDFPIDYIISLGDSCSSRVLLTELDLIETKSNGRKSHPFDLIFCEYKQICTEIKTDFSHFFNNLEMIDGSIKADGKEFPHEAPKGIYEPDTDVWDEKDDFVTNSFVSLKSRYFQRIVNFYNDIAKHRNILFVFLQSSNIIPNELFCVLSQKFPKNNIKLLSINYYNETYSFDDIETNHFVYKNVKVNGWWTDGRENIYPVLQSFVTKMCSNE